MDRKFPNRLRRSFEKRGGRIEIPSEMPPEMMRAFLEQLLDCPDCRTALLEACNADDRKSVDIDAVIRDLALSSDH